jgi:hypothetical protein
MAKQRTLNEIRQEKEYQNCTGDVKTGTNTTVKNLFENEEVDKAIETIVKTLQPEIFDAIFEAVNTEMGDNFLFQSDNYLTEAGEELFEDQWFEWYHEQHGKIMHKLLEKLK